MPDAPPANPPELPEELDDAAYQRALALILDVGSSLVSELKTPSKEVTVIDRANAFERVALANRRTIILSRDIAQFPTEPASRETKRTHARQQVIRTVEESIGNKAEPADAPALRLELLERVDAPEFDTDLAHRSPGELIQEICRDLGLADIPAVLRYPRRTPEDIAILRAQAAAPAGSGLPQWLAAVTPQAKRNETSSDIRLKEH